MGARLRSRSAWGAFSAAFALLVTAIAAAARTSSFSVALTRDTGQMLYGGMIVLSGRVPYRDAALNKGPMAYLLAAVQRLIVPRSELGVRLTLLAAAVVAAAALAAYLSRVGNRRTAVMGGLLFAALAAMTAFEGEDPDLEQFAVAPMALALALSAHDAPAAVWTGGVALAVAGLLSPVFLIPLVPAVGWTIWTTHFNRRRDLFRIVLAAVGVGVAVGVWLLVGGALNDVTRQVPGTFGGPPSGGLLSIRRLVSVPARGLWLLGLTATVVAMSERRHRIAATCALGWIVLSWARVKFGDYLAWDPEYDHHYYPALIGLCAGIALGLEVVWSARPVILGAAVSVLVAGALIVTLVVVPERATYRIPVATRGIGAQPWGEADRLAAWIDRHTRPADRIFVSGSEPQVYWLADRFAPTPLFDSYAILAYRPYQARLTRDLYRHPPRAIAAVAFDLPDAYLTALLKAMRYRLAYASSVGRVWMRSPGR